LSGLRSALSTKSKTLAEYSDCKMPVAKTARDFLNFSEAFFQQGKIDRDKICHEKYSNFTKLHRTSERLDPKISGNRFYSSWFTLSQKLYLDRKSNVTKFLRP
jgi:hypothetical protein